MSRDRMSHKSIRRLWYALAGQHVLHASRDLYP
jgi:hypothetical protein